MSFSIFLAAAGAIALSAMALIGLPLLRPRGFTPDGSAVDALRQRLQNIARDCDSGLIDAAGAAEAEIEAKRVAIRDGARADLPQSEARALRLAAVAFLGVAPLAAAGLYLWIGAPALIDPPDVAAPADIAALPDEDRREMISQMVAGLAARLEADPEDADGWRMLGRSQSVLDLPADSAASYRRLFALQAGDLEDWRNYASALAAMSPDKRFPVDPEFLHALGEIEKRAPGDMMALFYRGGAAREAGDAAGAAALWRRLLVSMPADAPVRATLEELIAQADSAALTNAVPK